MTYSRDGANKLHSCDSDTGGHGLQNLALTTELPDRARERTARLASSTRSSC